MKQSIKRIGQLAALTPLCILAACAPASQNTTTETAASSKTMSGPDIMLTEDATGSRTDIPVGVPFEVSLGGNGGTGYQWELTPVPGMTLVKSDINAHTPGLPGGAYTHNFILRAKTAGEYRLFFRHHRAWEKDTAAAKTVEFTVVAR